MGVIVPFTYATWSSTFPQFSTTVTEAAFDSTIYPLAQQYWPNDGSSLAKTAQSQTNLLGLMCSHIAQLLFGTDVQPASALVGRINSAGEGSVNVSAEMPLPSDDIQAWLQQTQFGAMFRAASAPYRTMHYVPARRRFFNR